MAHENEKRDMNWRKVLRAVAEWPLWPYFACRKRPDTGFFDRLMFCGLALLPLISLLSDWNWPQAIVVYLMAGGLVQAIRYGDDHHDHSHHHHH
jgi:hypothetical protein